MGDRGNIVIRSSQSNRDDVWFYGHWSGSEMPEVVKRALAKKWRWGDTAYLARIVFDELTALRQGEETSFGISTRLQDNEHPIIVVDDDKQRVFLIQEKELKDYRIPEEYAPSQSKNYEEYINGKCELFNADETPFNLAGELLDQGITPEGEARKRAQAEAEAKKTQLKFCSCGAKLGIEPHAQSCLTYYPD